MRKKAGNAGVVALLGMLSLAACGGDGGGAPENPVTPAGPAAPAGPSFLVSPAQSGRFHQNDAAIGCPAHSTRGYGIRLSFDWRDVPGAAAYRIVFRQKNAQFPAIEQVVDASEYTETRCNAFVIDRNLDEWAWKVAALAPAPDDSSRPGEVILWSEEREFGFEPCRLADGRSCYAPAPPPQP